MEVTKGCCRPIKKGFQRNNSPRYYLSFNRGEIVGESESEEPHVVVQMDTESPILYQKTCLDYYFDKPLHVSLYCETTHHFTYSIDFNGLFNHVDCILFSLKFVNHSHINH